MYGLFPQFTLEAYSIGQESENQLKGNEWVKNMAMLGHYVWIQIAFKPQ